MPSTSQVLLKVLGIKQDTEKIKSMHFRGLNIYMNYIKSMLAGDVLLGGEQRSWIAPGWVWRVERVVTILNRVISKVS